MGFEYTQQRKPDFVTLTTFLPLSQNNFESRKIWNFAVSYAFGQVENTLISTS
jgi:hypothetical protein